MKNQTRLRLFGSVRVLCGAAILTALAVAIAYFCKIYFTFTPYLRLTFENLPIILSGIMFGPAVGFSVGLCADLLPALVVYGAGGINPFLTIAAGVVGLLAGLMWRYLPWKRLRLAATVFIPHIAGNMILKSAGFMIWYAAPLPLLLPRIPLYAVIAAAEFVILKLFLSHSATKKLMERKR